MLLKGNLHTHTTISDGAKKPEEVLSMYAEAGYDFIAITDHYSFYPTEISHGMTVISGIEYDTGVSPLNGVWHIVALGMEKDPGISRFPSKKSVEEIVRTIKAFGGTVDLAHPAWSMNRPEKILELKDFVDCTEIYNSISGIPFNARPYSGGIIDMLALEGWYPPCIAVDDVHFYKGDELRSYIVADCSDNTPDSILNSVRSGKFFATQGPEFSVNIDGEKVYVECTPCEYVCFYTDTLYVPDRVTSGCITRAEYRIKPSDTFVRVELIDSDGRFGWSSAYPVSL